MTQITITELPTTVNVSVGATPSTGPFTFQFEWYTAADVAVYVDDVQLSTAGYSVATTGGTIFDDGTRGGQVTLTSAVSNATVTIKLETGITKTVNMSPSQFDAELLNTQVSRLFSVLRAFDERLDRAIVNLPSGSGLTLPSTTARALKYLGFDAAGDLTVLSETDGAVSVSLAMEPVVGAASLAAAIELLLESVVTTEGDLVVQGASAPGRLAIGTAGQIPRVNTGATGLEYADPAWRYVETQTVTAGNGIEFTDLEAGVDHGFEFQGIDITTGSAQVFRARTSPDTGASPTYDSGASDYDARIMGVNSAGAASGVRVAVNAMGIATNGAANDQFWSPTPPAGRNAGRGFVWLENPTDATRNTDLHIDRMLYYALSGDELEIWGRAWREATAAVNAIRFFFGSWGVDLMTTTCRHFVRDTRS